MIRYEACPKRAVKFHELANLFPMMDREDRQSLRSSIRDLGVLEPIVMLDGAILDGRNRYMEARDLGVEYPVTDYDGADPLGFVIAKNLGRRHLTSSQRAMVASRVAKLQQGARTDLPKAANLPEVSVKDAARAFNVSERSVRDANTVRRSGDGGLIQSVEQGETSVSSAARQIRDPSPRTPGFARAFNGVIRAMSEVGEPGEALTAIRSEGATFYRGQAADVASYFHALSLALPEAPRDPLEGAALDEFAQKCKDYLRSCADDAERGLLLGCIGAYNKGRCPSQKQIDGAVRVMKEQRTAIKGPLIDADDPGISA